MTYDNGNLIIPLHAILDRLTPDEKNSLVDYLSCDEQILENVTSQIMTGWTDGGSHGSRGCGFDEVPHTALDKARRAVAMASESVAKEELKAAINTLRSQQAWHDHYRDWAFEMYHAWGKTSRPPERQSPTHDATLQYEVIKKS